MTRRALILASCLTTFAVACSDDAASVDETTGSETTDSPSTSVDTTQTTTTVDPDTSTSPSTTIDPDTSTSLTTDPTTSTESSSTTADDTSSTGDDSGTTGEPVDPGELVECDNDIPAAPDGEVCVVTPGTSGAILLRGTVLAGHRVFENGTVLVEGGGDNARILCTSCDCADEPAAADATIVDCAQGVISPGLVNPHDHITFTLSQPQGHGTERYDHRHEWRLGQNGHDPIDTFPGSDSSLEGILWGEVRMLLGGATSVTGSISSNDARGLLRNLDAADMTEGLTGVDVNYRTFPLGDSSGPTVLGDCDYPGIDGSFNLEDDVYLPHIAEGVNERANNEFQCMSGAPGGEELIVGHTSVIHGIGMLADDVSTMATARAELVWSPRSNIDLYGITADVPTYRNLGVAVALGTDWTASGSMNMLRELRCADSIDTEHYGDIIPDRDLWLMATYWAAQASGADDQIGLLRPGHIADIAIFDGSVNTHHRAVIEAGVQDVALVMRGGAPLYGDAAVIEGLVDPGVIDQCESIAELDACGSSKRVCVQLDTGLTIPALTAAVDPASYELFFCGDPTGEPSCDPLRDMEFPARDGVEDGDGDGIPDDSDNCPTVFNPIRPLDQGAQADDDQDDIGDSCDLCPLEDGENCVPPSLFDRDDDDIIDFDDNCADVPNPDQADMDDDWLGDDCDACPLVPNPGGGACPSSIYEIKDGTVPEDSAVVLANVLVTAAAPTGYFVQVHPDDPSYIGPEYSGVFVFHGDGGFSPTPGDRVDLEGTVTDFFGQIQITASADAQVVSSGNDDVPATATTVDAIVEGGVDQAALEGVVVEIADLQVTDTSPPGGPGDNNPVGEFEVAGGLRVNDFFYLITPPPVVDQVFPQLTGVARWANDYTKLEPRGPQDIPGSLVSFGPAQSFLLLGSDDVVPLPDLQVVLSSIVDADTPVDLAYDDPAILSGPAQVVVQAGSSSASVPLDGLAVGFGDVTASYGGTDIVATVRVYDDAEPRTPTLTPESLVLAVDASAPLTVTLNLPAPAGGQNVAISANPGTSVMVMPFVVVPAGELSVDFDVTAIGFGDEVITADIAGATDTTDVSVVDIPTYPDLRIVEVYYNHTGADDLFEWVKIYNGTAATVDLAGYSLGWGGTDYTYGTLQLAGSIASGECFLVGGPNGNAVSGFPGMVVFDQALDFNPDMQNSGADADGVALFDLAAPSITANTVPVHAVIYGPANSNGLLDESGAAGNVDIANIPDEQSLRMNEDETWSANLDPTPTACLPLA